MRTSLARNLAGARLWWRRTQYARQFTSCGPNFQPQGRMDITCEGQLVVGSDFMVRSASYLPVQIYVGKGARLTLGNRVFLNQGVRISCRTRVEIGDNTLLGDEVLILDSDWHELGNRPLRTEPVIIEANVWVAARSTILRGVTLGEGCVVAAGSVVTRSVPPNTVVGGVPAKVLRSVTRDQAGQ